MADPELREILCIEAQVLRPVEAEADPSPQGGQQAELPTVQPAPTGLGQGDVQGGQGLIVPGHAADILEEARLEQRQGRQPVGHPGVAAPLGEMTDDGPRPGKHPAVERGGPAVAFEDGEKLPRLQGLIVQPQARRRLVGHDLALGQGDHRLKVDLDLPVLEGGHDGGLRGSGWGRDGARRDRPRQRRDIGGGCRLWPLDGGRAFRWPGRFDGTGWGGRRGGDHGGFRRAGKGPKLCNLAVLAPHHGAQVTDDPAEKTDLDGEFVDLGLNLVLGRSRAGGWGSLLQAHEASG